MPGLSWLLWVNIFGSANNFVHRWNDFSAVQKKCVFSCFCSPTAKLAMGSLVQNNSGAIRCSCKIGSGVRSSPKNDRPGRPFPAAPDLCDQFQLPFLELFIGSFLEAKQQETSFKAIVGVCH